LGRQRRRTRKVGGELVGVGVVDHLVETSTVMLLPSGSSVKPVNWIWLDGGELPLPLVANRRAAYYPIVSLGAGPVHFGVPQLGHALDTSRALNAR
jgi:hypothetical protein